MWCIFSMTGEVIQSGIQRRSHMTVTNDFSFPFFKQCSFSHLRKKVTRQPSTCKMTMLLTEGYNKLFANWKFLRFIFCISYSYFFECCLIIIMRRRMRGWRTRRRRRRTSTLYRQWKGISCCLPMIEGPLFAKSYFGAPPCTLRYDKHFFNLSKSQVINKKSAVVENYRLIVTFGYTRLFVLSNLIND